MDFHSGSFLWNVGISLCTEAGLRMRALRIYSRHMAVHDGPSWKFMFTSEAVCLHPSIYWLCKADWFLTRAVCTKTGASLFVYVHANMTVMQLTSAASFLWNAGISLCTEAGSRMRAQWESESADIEWYMTLTKIQKILCRFTVCCSFSNQETAKL